VSEAARGARFALTLSAGIAVFPAHTDELDELIRLADSALYAAKRAGRNRSVVYTPGTPAPRTASQEAAAAERRELLGTVRALAAAVDAKDASTHQHSRRVAVYAAALARSLELPRDHLERITQAAILHDVGKIAIPEAVLLKPAQLTPTEVDEMRRHSVIGHDIIANAGLTDAAVWVRHLHERFDGGGYPDGLHGNRIPFESRILAVADALEAMVTARRYRPALAMEDALAELEDGAGTQFDPALARQMVALVRDGEVRVGEVDIQLAANGDLDADVARLATLASAGAR
jgi:HD-GYP domain-containing protein (c-di-GMP phosphodiesterase class II)